jgi:hypothetical protein
MTASKKNWHSLGTGDRNRAREVLPSHFTPAVDISVGARPYCGPIVCLGTFIVHCGIYPKSEESSNAITSMPLSTSSGMAASIPDIHRAALYLATVPTPLPCAAPVRPLRRQQTVCSRDPTSAARSRRAQCCASTRPRKDSISSGRLVQQRSIALRKSVIVRNKPIWARPTNARQTRAEDARS